MEIIHLEVNFDTVVRDGVLKNILKVPIGRSGANESGLKVSLSSFSTIVQKLIIMPRKYCKIVKISLH